MASHDKFTENTRGLKMAFADGTLVAIQVANSDAGKFWLYKEDATIAAIRADSYFDAAYPEYGITDEDIIMIVGSDGFGLSSIDITAGVVTVVESVTSA